MAGAFQTLTSYGLLQTPIEWISRVHHEISGFAADGRHSGLNVFLRDYEEVTSTVCFLTVKTFWGPELVKLGHRFVPIDGVLQRTHSICRHSLSCPC
jgi:hypothetical protein